MSEESKSLVNSYLKICIRLKSFSVLKHSKNYHIACLCLANTEVFRDPEKPEKKNLKEVFALVPVLMVMLKVYISGEKAGGANWQKRDKKFGKVGSRNLPVEVKTNESCDS